jgi:hypothetical protein
MSTVGYFIAADSVTLGDSCFIYRILIFTYLIFELFKHYGEMLQAQVEQLEALQEADRQRMEALEAQRVAMEQRQQQQMTEVLQYMQALRQKMGVAPPASLFVTPPPPPLGHATPVSMSIIV